MKPHASAVAKHFLENENEFYKSFLNQNKLKDFDLCVLYTFLILYFISLSKFVYIFYNRDGFAPIVK